MATKAKTVTKEVPVTKAQLIQKSLGIFSKPVLQKVDDIEPLDGIYVRAFTAKEFRDFTARTEEFDKNYKDGYNAERTIALQLFDSEGVQIFDPENMEDVMYLAKLPFGITQTMSVASAMLNTPTGLKNALAIGKHSL